jgi:hypothetical protein
MDSSVGSLQNNKELRPENFENTMTSESNSAIIRADAIAERESKIRNEINSKESKNK